jgi:hypothetical protein
MATKAEWLECFRDYDIIALTLIELMSDHPRRKRGWSGILIRQMLGWLAINP